MIVEIYAYITALLTLLKQSSSKLFLPSYPPKNIRFASFSLAFEPINGINQSLTSSNYLPTCRALLPFGPYQLIYVSGLPRAIVASVVGETETRDLLIAWLVLSRFTKFALCSCLLLTLKPYNLIFMLTWLLYHANRMTKFVCKILLWYSKQLLRKLQQNLWGRVFFFTAPYMPHMLYAGFGRPWPAGCDSASWGVVQQKLVFLVLIGSVRVIYDHIWQLRCMLIDVC